MLSKEMHEDLNEQMKFELYSGYLYLAMSAWFADLSLAGFAKWMRIQAQEELAHAMHFYDYIVARGGKVLLQAIDAPPVEWKSPLHAFQATLGHEQQVTTRIHTLMDKAFIEKDHPTVAMLQWFVNEQIEEEESANEVLNKLKLVGNTGECLLFLDKELGLRTLTQTAA
ncbi:Bacterial non-heme ferritin [Desulfovibrionales bacterium]